MRINLLKGILASLLLLMAAGRSTQAGVVMRVFYDEISGTAVEDLVNASHFPDGPNPTLGALFTELLTESLDTGPDTDAAINDFGSHIRGFLEVPMDGNYQFFLASDDASELWLSTDHEVGNTNLVAFETSCCTEVFSGARLAERSSDPISLMSGQRYYFEIRHKENTGDEFLRVGWQKPDGTQEIIPVHALQPFPLENTASGGIQPSSDVAPQILSDYFGQFTPNNGQPASTNVTESQPARFNVTYLASQPVTIQWQMDGTDIEGANNSSLLIPQTSLDNNGAQITVVIGNEFGETTSAAATLNVAQDNEAPTIASALTQGNPNGLVVEFSEAVEESTATDASNYSINNGVTIDSVERLDSNRVRLNTSTIEPGQVYTVTATGVQDLASTPNSSDSQADFVQVQGVIMRKEFQGVTGTDLGTLQNHPKFPDNPDVVDFPDIFETPVDVQDNYGVQFVGLFTPTETGDHTFYISSDDQGVLFLSTDEDPANKVEIASEPSWNGARQWVETARRPNMENVSEPQTLEAGNNYYIEALMNEGGGGDNLAVLVVPPGGVTPQNGDPPISGAHLSTLIPSGPVEITGDPSDQTVVEFNSATFGVEVTGTPPYTYQWFRDGEIILGANESTYTLPEVALSDDGAQFSVEVANAFSSATSGPGTLSVDPDTTPPVVEGRAEPSGGRDSVRLFFSEPITPATAEDVGNYEITSDAGTLDVTGASLSSDQMIVTLETATHEVGVRYTVIVNGIQDFADSPNTIAADSEAVFFGLGGIVQDENGFVVFEVEDFDRNLDGNWAEDTERGNPSGGASMVVPNGGGGSEDATKLEFDVEFTQTGRHIVWYRASGNDGTDDSGWFHFDGGRPPSRTDGNTDSMSGFSGAMDFVWNSDPQDGDSPFDFEVPTTGLHTVAIALREDGSFFDKMIITTDENFTPSGLGPPSTREGTPPLPTVEITSPSDGATFSLGADITIEVNVESTAGAVTGVEFFADGEKIGESTESPFSFTWENVSEGRYSLEARVTNDILDTATSEGVDIVVGEPPPQALLVVGAIGDEQDVIGRLQSLGFDVKVVDAPSSTPEDADGSALIVLSSTLGSGDVTDKFTDAAIPLLNWEQALQDDLLFTGDTDGTDRATIDNQTDLDIVNTDHPMAAGLSGTVTVYDTPGTMSWGNPGDNADNATQIASVAGNPDQWLIYGYESGATLVDGSTAADRRVHFFFADNTAATLTDEGWQLFDAAIEWVVDGLPEPPSDQPTLTVSNRSAASFSLNWDLTGFHLQEADSLSDPQWTDVPGGDTPPVTIDLDAEQKYFRLSD